ncbi:MAG: hypothetical protein HXY34_10260 [Candidatus Thorarchaeota archaeon]|nr:hypothetical protein [Candidatus Thorarchaeota archaeon]
MQGTSLLDSLLRDTLSGSTWAVAVILGVMTWTLLSKNGIRVTATTGLAVYFASFLVYTVLSETAFLYYETLRAVFLGLEVVNGAGVTVWIIGMNVLVYSIEADLLRGQRRRRTLTVLSVSYSVLLVPLLIIGVKVVIAFVGLALILVYDTWVYTRDLLHLEAVKRRLRPAVFMLGLGVIGFANFIVSLDNTYSGHLLKNAGVLIGSLMLMRVWEWLPTIEDLEWYATLERLMVVDPVSAIPLLDFRFRVSEEPASGTSVSAPIDGALVAGAVSGIDSLVDEILLETTGVDAISHRRKTILFHRRAQFICILVVTAPLLETKYRLEMFAQEFEKTYNQQLAAFSGHVGAFSGTEAIIRQVFF